jgi:hypothetical protein
MRAKQREAAPIDTEKDASPSLNPVTPLGCNVKFLALVL